MKKIFTFTLLLLLAFSLIGCNSEQTPEPTDAAQTQAATEEKTDKTEKPTEDKKDEDLLPENAVIISAENGCRIVYTDEVLDQALAIYDQIWVLDPLSHDDELYYEMLPASKEATSEKLEILVGMTGRDQSNKSKDSLQTYLDFTVEVIDGKIVINSYSSASTTAAVEHFVSCLEVYDDKVVYLPSEDKSVGKHTDYAASNMDVLGISLNEFSFVLPETAEAYELAAVKVMVDWIGTNTGAIIEIRYDTEQKRPYEMLVGKTNRTDSTEIFDSLEENGYIFKVVTETDDVKILYAYNSSDAFNALIEKIATEISQSGSVPTEISGKIS